MRIATRLVLALSVLFAAIMVLYALLTQRQREAQIGAALAHETAVLAEALQIVTNNALRDRRFADLDQVLERLVEDTETYAAAVLDAEGQVLAGGRESDLGCLRRAILEREPTEGDTSGWTECGTTVRWVALPVREPGATLVLARYATLMEREIATSRWRHMLLTLTLVGTGMLAVVVVLRHTLSAPLAEVMRGVRSLGDEAPAEPIRVAPAAGELGGLASAFNGLAAQLEARRRTLQQQAEERVTLERRLREAEAYALLGRLTGGLAHELGSPLNVIGVRAEAIQSSGECTPPAREHATEILAEVERIARLVRGLLHVARRHGIDPSPVNLAEVVGAVARQIGGEPEMPTIALRLEIPAEPVVVQGDRTLLRHAVLNLARNSVQALAKHSSARYMRIALVRKADRVQVVVEDSGPGIPAAVLEHVFEPFFTTKDVGEGTGLGLAISRGIAEEHGGTLELEAAEGRGARAVLTLPVNGPRPRDSDPS